MVEEQNETAEVPFLMRRQIAVYEAGRAMLAWMHAELGYDVVTKVGGPAGCAGAACLMAAASLRAHLIGTQVCSVNVDGCDSARRSICWTGGFCAGSPGHLLGQPGRCCTWEAA